MPRRTCTKSQHLPQRWYSPVEPVAAVVAAAVEIVKASRLLPWNPRRVLRHGARGNPTGADPPRMRTAGPPIGRRRWTAGRREWTITSGAAWKAQRAPRCPQRRSGCRWRRKSGAWSRTGHPGRSGPTPRTRMSLLPLLWIRVNQKRPAGSGTTRKKASWRIRGKRMMSCLQQRARANEMVTIPKRKTGTEGRRVRQSHENGERIETTRSTIGPVAAADPRVRHRQRSVLLSKQLDNKSGHKCRNH